jgi:hypothetical protein
MMKKAFLSFVAAWLAVSMFASPGLAGTKWGTNLVPASDTDPVISPKSKASFKDKGQLKAGISGLTDGGGMLVTTNESYKKNDLLDGDEYMVILSGIFVALGVDFSFNLPIELKEGKGSGKIDAADLFSLITPGLHRASEMTTIKVVGPLGVGNVPDCQSNLTAGGYVILGNPNPCDQGTLIGVGGVLIP